MTDPTPFQTSPALKNAAGLSQSHEYASIWTGQSNSRPWGYPADALTLADGQAPALDLQDTGVDLTLVTIPNNTSRQVGAVEDIVVTASSTQSDDSWNTETWLRMGTSSAPQPGYALVLSNHSSAGSATTLRVRWISLPTNNSTAAGYLVRENGNFASYDSVRVLTSYTPLQDIRPPIGSGTEWLAPVHAPYPTANGRLASGGRRLLLPSPYAALPGAVDGFDDLGLFLGLTRREGADGYGISEIADSTFNGTGDPTGHPILSRSGEVFTFANAISANADLLNAYILVDWEASGASKRSWSQVASNTTTTFTANGTWLGDGIPDTPPTATVTFDLGTEEVIWTGHGLLDGDKVVFTTTGALPTEITAGRVYFVKNVNGADRFQIATSPDHATIALSGTPSGTNTGTRAWIYTVWIPHWKDSPYTWIPGPEFAYPNEDQQPQAPFVHFRARGQLRYYHRELLDPDIFSGALYTPFDGTADSRFGALLPCAYRMALGLGKRINVIALGVNSTGLLTLGILNSAAYPGVIGWWNGERYGYSLSQEDLAASVLSNRLKRLITVIAPNALLIENNTKTMRVLSAAHIQGETDAALDSGRELYAATITDYKRWLRDLVTDAGFNPYTGEAVMPFVQPLITNFPWEDTGTGISFQAFGADLNGEVNAAIREMQTVDEFADFVQTEDLPKLIYTNGVPDYGHFSGEGMAALGARLGAASLGLIEHAFSYSSATLSSTNARLLRIANLALLYVGQDARQITSLTENTTEARLVSTMLPEVTRQLLSMRQWSWALKIEPAAQVKHDNPQWLYAYAVPGRAITPIEILPPPDVEGSAITTSANLVSVLAPSVRDEIRLATDEPESFEIGRSASGHPIIYTNVPQIEGTKGIGRLDGVIDSTRRPRRALIRYIDKVIDPDRYSSSFSSALSWLLASALAPALVKGQEGEAVSIRCMQRAAGYIGVEAQHETATRQRTIEHRPPWIAGR